MRFHMETEEKFESPWVTIVFVDGDGYEELREEFRGEYGWNHEGLVNHLRQQDRGEESEYDPYVPPTGGQAEFYRDPEAVRYPWGARDDTVWDGEYTLAINDHLSYLALHRRVRQPWDYRRFLSVVKDVIDERGEDFVYTPPGPDLSCRYMHDGKPSCLLGAAMERYGIALSPLNEGQTIESLLRDWNFRVPQEQCEELSVIQDAQDRSLPYGTVWAEHEERVRRGIA